MRRLREGGPSSPTHRASARDRRRARRRPSRHLQGRPGPGGPGHSGPRRRTMPATYADRRLRAMPRSVAPGLSRPRSEQAPYRRFRARCAVLVASLSRCQIIHSGATLAIAHDSPASLHPSSADHPPQRPDQPDEVRITDVRNGTPRPRPSPDKPQNRLRQEKHARKASSDENRYTESIGGSRLRSCPCMRPGPPNRDVRCNALDAIMNTWP